MILFLTHTITSNTNIHPYCKGGYLNNASSLISVIENCKMGKAWLLVAFVLKKKLYSTVSTIEGWYVHDDD
jgi:hypothetical protein